jgi:hypothetical protein
MNLLSDIFLMFTITSINPKFKQFLTSLLFLLFLNNSFLNAQILKDSVSLRLIKESIDNIYNLEFKKAAENFTKIQKAYPGHSVVYLLNGLKTYWENYPLITTTPAHGSFENDLRKCIELTEKNAKQADEYESLLANLSARGFLLLYYADNDLTMEVIPLAASTYPFIRRSFGYTSVLNDFLFFTGLYNYTREAYPEAYPVYKTVAFMFPKGDKEKGLKELQTSARSSIFLKAESLLFLSGISISIENDFNKAYSYSKTLYEKYPSNPEFLSLYIRNLLLIKKYDEAELVMKSNESAKANSFYLAQFSIFNGILYEKKYRNDKLAGEYYSAGVKALAGYGHYGNEYSAYGYYGLSRISNRKGDDSFRKTYRKKADELADFKKVNFD